MKLAERLQIERFLVSNLLKHSNFDKTRALNKNSITTPEITHDDGFAVTTAEPWVKYKIQLIRQYVTAFVNALSRQVDEVVLVDLYSRNGLYCLGAKKEIFAGIPLMALQLDLPISKYVFCESDSEQARILKIRINKYFRGKNVVLLNDGRDQLIDKLKMYVPDSRKSHKVATLCIADAFGMEPGLDFIKQLLSHDFTFLIPLTFHLGKKIDHRFYLSNKEKMKDFLGLEATADLGSGRIIDNQVFYRRLVQRLEAEAKEIGLNTSLSTHRLDSGLMEIATYNICLFSRKYSAKAIQHDALSGSTIQFALFNQN